MNLTRRHFAHLGAASTLGAALSPLTAQTEASAPKQNSAQATPANLAHDLTPGVETADRFHFAVVSDTHIIDRFYKPGSENGIEDNESILKTAERLTLARETVNRIRFANGSRIEQVFLPGDVFHNYPSPDYDFYFQNETRLDIAKRLIDGFQAPTHLGWGNHDYDVPRVSRDMSHRLFQAKFQTTPYWSFDYKGFRFLMLNNFLGATWDEHSSVFHKDIGSLGEEHLQWTEAQLASRMPTVVFIHYPLWSVAPVEVRDFGLHPLLRKYQDSIQIVIAGHWHKWIDFAHTYGPQHTVTAATRYDPNAFMIFEAFPREGVIRWLDNGRPQWSTHYTTPYS